MSVAVQREAVESLQEVNVRNLRAVCEAGV